MFRNRPGIIAFAFFAIAALAALFSVASYKNDSGAPAVANQHAVAALEGFTPGADVRYKIMPKGAPDFAGKGVVGDDGTLQLYAGPGNSDGAALTYDLSVTEKKGADPFNLALTFNGANGEVSILGDGFDKFSDIITTRGGDLFKTSADWAGRYRDQTPWNFGVNRHDPFTFAFFDNNDIASDMPANPKILKILYAPGGGGFSPPGGVNGYTVPSNFCESVNGKTIPSFCVPLTTAPFTVGTYNAGSPHMRKVGFHIIDNFARAMIMMAHQLSTPMLLQTQSIGMFIDAKQQLETQRLIQQLNAQAHKDYEPSEMMCQVGSFIKSLPRSEEVSALNKQAMNNVLMTFYRNLEDTSGSEGYALDIEARIRQFRWKYCDVRDNNDGLQYMCEHDQDQNLANSTQGAGPDLPLPPPASVTPYNGGGIGAQTPTPASNERKNKDIDYGRLLGYPLTMKLNFTDGTTTNDEEDLMALARNLYWPKALETPLPAALPSNVESYLDERSLFAMHNVAHNSFVQLASMKAETDPGLGAASGWNFMKAMMRDFGLSDASINQMLGDYPSYYAQMEVLTKKMYQSPDFFTQLYDKPTNVKRIGAALDAIKIMQTRDMLEARQRTEMLTSMMVEQELAPIIVKLNAQAAKAVKDMH